MIIHFDVGKEYLLAKFVFNSQIIMWRLPRNIFFLKFYKLDDLSYVAYNEFGGIGGRQIHAE